MKVDHFSTTGEKKGQVELPKELFAAKINADLMHRAVVMRLANRRNPIAHAITRGEVSRTTKKAFRQKGTGNARRGAMSTSLVHGGGVTHGPRNTRNFTIALPKKERRAALFSSLTSRAGEGSVFCWDGLDAKEPKTKDLISVLTKMTSEKKVLLVLSEKNAVLEKSARNIPGVQTILAAYLNPYDVLHYTHIFFVGDAVKKAEDVFSLKSA